MTTRGIGAAALPLFYHIILTMSCSMEVDASPNARALILNPLPCFPFAQMMFVTLGVTNDATRPRTPPDVIPVAPEDNAVEEKAALEPATTTKDADEDILEVKCPLPPRNLRSRHRSHFESPHRQRTRTATTRTPK